MPRLVRSRAVPALAALVMLTACSGGDGRGDGGGDGGAGGATSRSATSRSDGPTSSTSSSTSTTTSAPTSATTSATTRGDDRATVAVPLPPRPTGGSLRPDPAVALEDKPAAYARGCQQKSGTEVVRCEVGDADGGRTVALVGDSKALQWVSTFDVIGRERGWRVVTMTKSGCPWTDAVTTLRGEPDIECRTWGGRVTDALLDLEPDLVVTSAVRGSAAPPDGTTRRSEAALVDGYVDVWDEVGQAGIPVAALTDTPYPGHDGDLPGCVAAHRDDPGACTIPFSEGSGTSALRAAAGRARSTTLVDLTGVLCPGRACRPTYGDVLIYRDGSHVTDTFARLLAPSLSPVLAALVRD